MSLSNPGLDTGVGVGEGGGGQYGSVRKYAGTGRGGG